jgi:Thermophilic metalloprotease (M29)
VHVAPVEGHIERAMPSAGAPPALALPAERSRREALIERLAGLSVAFAANVQTGQTLVVSAEPGQESLVRAVARSAYRHGARFVDTDYFDPHVKRARIEYAHPDTLGFIPSWHRERSLALGDHRCSSIALIGDVTPRLLNDLDPELVARCEFPAVPEELRVINDRTMNWTAIPCRAKVGRGSSIRTARARRRSIASGQTLPSPVDSTRPIRFERGVSAPPSWPLSPTP